MSGPQWAVRHTLRSTWVVVLGQNSDSCLIWQACLLLTISCVPQTNPESGQKVLAGAVYAAEKAAKMHSRNKQRERKVNQHNVLRMPWKQCGLEVKRVQEPSSVFWRSLDDNFSGHLGVDRAEVGIFAGLREGVGKLLIRIEHFGLEHLFRADHGVRDIVAIDPRDGCSHGD